MLIEEFLKPMGLTQQELADGFAFLTSESTNW